MTLHAVTRTGNLVISACVLSMTPYCDHVDAYYIQIENTYRHAFDGVCDSDTITDPKDVASDRTI